MQTSRFVTSISPDRKAEVQAAIENLGASRPRELRPGVLAYTIGCVAINDNPPLSVRAISERTGFGHSHLIEAAIALEACGFIARNVGRSNARGRPATLLAPEPILYDGIAITPSWQETTRICMLATDMGITTGQAISRAVSEVLLDYGYEPRIGVE